jgi:hypothetical protein
METWATFSIIDHREPVYRQALALFDRIVVPVPPEPIGDQTKAELAQLAAEVEYLSGHKAATRFDLDSDAFQEWRRPYLAEAASASLNRDIFQDTRLMTAQKLQDQNVQAVPVYGGMAEYNTAKGSLMQVEQALTVEILQRLPVPESDTPLENLVQLRQRSAFRTALDNLLEWKRLQAPAIFLQEDRAAAMAAALKDFDRLTRAYSDAMEAEGYKKWKTVGSIFLSACRGDLIGALKEGAVSFSEVREPSWKKVSGLKCAPGGLVYHFKEALPKTKIQ